MAYLRDKEFLKQFGLHLKGLRISKNMTQADLAYRSGMEISQISRMERGLLNTSISNLALMAQILEVHPKELLDF